MRASVMRSSLAMSVAPVPLNMSVSTAKARSLDESATMGALIASQTWKIFCASIESALGVRMWASGAGRTPLNRHPQKISRNVREASTERISGVRGRSPRRYSTCAISLALRSNSG